MCRARTPRLPNLSNSCIQPWITRNGPEHKTSQYVIRHGFIDNYKYICLVQKISFSFQTLPIGKTATFARMQRDSQAIPAIKLKNVVCFVLLVVYLFPQQSESHFCNMVDHIITISGCGISKLQPSPTNSPGSIPACTLWNDSPFQVIILWSEALFTIIPYFSCKCT